MEKILYLLQKIDASGTFDWSHYNSSGFDPQAKEITGTLEGSKISIILSPEIVGEVPVSAKCVGLSVKVRINSVPVYGYGAGTLSTSEENKIIAAFYNIRTKYFNKRMKEDSIKSKKAADLFAILVSENPKLKS